MVVRLLILCVIFYSQLYSSDIMREMNLRVNAGYMYTGNSELINVKRMDGSLSDVSLNNLGGHAGILSAEVRHKFNYLPNYRLDAMLDYYGYDKVETKDLSPIEIVNTDGTRQTFLGGKEVVLNKISERYIAELSQKLFYDLFYWRNNQMYLGMAYKYLRSETYTNDRIIKRENVKTESQTSLGAYMALFHNFDYGIQVRGEVEYAYDPKMLDLTFLMNYHTNANFLIGVGYKYKDYNLDASGKGIEFNMSGPFITVGYHFGSL